MNYRARIPHSWRETLRRLRRIIRQRQSVALHRTLRVLGPAAILCFAILFQSGCQSLTIAPSRKREIRAVLGRYQEALNQRSADKLLALVGDTIQVEGMTDELSRAGLKSGMYWPPSAIGSFQILSMRQSGAGTEVKAAFYFRNSVLMMRIGFDEALRIRTIDPVPLWKIPQAKVAKAFSSAFVESKGLMFVRARVNERPGFFLVDTGSTGFLLNKKYFQPDFRSALPGITSTVQGIKPHLGAGAIGSFEWGELRAGEIRGQLHDFSAMEAPEITPLLGAIGHEQLKNCAVVFDWQNRKISVRPATDGRGSPANPKSVVPFTYFLHVPEIPVKIGDTTCRMIFDSGAQINLVPNLNGIENHFRKAQAVTKISDGGQYGRETALLGLIDETQIGAARFRDFPFAVFDVPYLAGHGILGSPLVQKGMLEVNFPNKTISLW